VEDPNETLNEFVYIVDDDMETYVILSHSLALKILEEETIKINMS